MPGLLLAAIPFIWAWLRKTHDVVDQLQWWRDETVKAAPYFEPYLAIVWTFILSPYFTLFLTLCAVGFLVWRAWPASSTTRAEFFIEMLEERIGVARALIKQTNVSLMDWKTWEEKTVLDMDRFISQPIYSRYIQLFRLAGELTTLEYEKGEESHKRAIGRQIRMLNELIDRIDRGDFQKEARTAHSTSF